MGKINLGGIQPGAKHPKYMKMKQGGPGAGVSENGTRMKRSDTMENVAKVEQATIARNKRKRRTRKKVTLDGKALENEKEDYDDDEKDDGAVTSPGEQKTKSKSSKPKSPKSVKRQKSKGNDKTDKHPVGDDDEDVVPNDNGEQQRGGCCVIL